MPGPILNLQEQLVLLFWEDSSKLSDNPCLAASLQQSDRWACKAKQPTGSSHLPPPPFTTSGLGLSAPPGAAFALVVAVAGHQALRALP